MYNPPRDLAYGIEHRKFNDSVLATINTIELNDVTFGTEKKPIPIFNMKILGNESDTLINTDYKSYRSYVSQYLEYYMPKKDFEKMFGKEASK